jgi:hypothetical protein
MVLFVPEGIAKQQQSLTIANVSSNCNPPWGYFQCRICTADVCQCQQSKHGFENNFTSLVPLSTVTFANRQILVISNWLDFYSTSKVAMARPCVDSVPFIPFGRGYGVERECLLSAGADGAVPAKTFANRIWCL